MDNVTDYINILTLVISLSAAIAAATRTPKGNTLSGRLYKILDVMALNFGKAKQKSIFKN